jgi:hypothetical protein
MTSLLLKPQQPHFWWTFLVCTSFASGSYLVYQNYKKHKEEACQKLPISPYSAPVTAHLREAMRSQQRQSHDKARYFFAKALEVYVCENFLSPGQQARQEEASGKSFSLSTGFFIER